MNWNVMLQVVMSAVFFAPLLIVLGAFLFVGVLVAFEGAVSLVRKGVLAGEGVPVAEASPEVGPIVEGLKGAIENEIEIAEATEEKAESSKASGG